MTFDITQLNLSDEPYEGMEEAIDQWREASEFPPPPQPGKKIATVADIRDAFQVDGVLKGVILDLMLHGEDEGKPLNFVRASSKIFVRQGTKTSQFLDIAMSSGIKPVPRTSSEFLRFFKYLLDSGTHIYFQGDWRGYCKTCSDNKLKEATSATTKEEADQLLNQMDPEVAKQLRNTAAKFATKFKNYRSFPEVPGAAKGENGMVPRMDVATCPDCGQDVRAMFNITRWLQSA